jgi:predicted DNA-binding transcriptional regulator AlpA
MPKSQAKQTKTYIGVAEVARRMNCHPMSIPRYVKHKNGFPKPGKLAGKNVWDEDIIDAYIAAEVGRHS